MSQIRMLRQSAQAAFTHLVQQTGRSAVDFSVLNEWVKKDRNRLHIVQHLSDGQGAEIILKHAMRPDDRDAFRAILKAHHNAWSALKDHPVAGVPQVLAHDVSTQSYLMRFVKGDTFLNLCRRSGDHTALLRAAGAWLCAYHTATFLEHRAFQPKFMARHMIHLADQVARGERRVRSARRFEQLARAIGDIAGPAEGHLGCVASKHGDLNAHNILIGGGRVHALDFLAPSNAPVGYDIARFLLSYMQMVGDVSALPKGHVVTPGAFDAFFEGYTLVTRDDPTVHFLMRVQILTDWNRMSDKTTFDSVLRHERIKKIARQAFA